MGEHGDFKIMAEGNVLYASIAGCWNEETAVSFKQQFMQLVTEQMPEQWAHIVLLDDWELGTPDIEPVIQELTQWCIDHGLQRAAQVFSISMLKRYQLNRMVTEKSGDFTRSQFKQAEDAALWLQVEGYLVSQENLVLVSTRD